MDYGRPSSRMIGSVDGGGYTLSSQKIGSEFLHLKDFLEGLVERWKGKEKCVGKGKEGYKGVGPRKDQYLSRAHAGHTERKQQEMGLGR